MAAYPTLPGNNQVDRLIFIIGNTMLFILLFVVVLIEIVYAKDITGKTTYEIIKAILAVSCALVISQVPSLLKLNLPMGIKAAGGAAFGLIVFFFPPQYLENKKIDISKTKYLPRKTKVLKLAILKSGNDEYSYTILNAFLDSVKIILNETEYKLQTPTILTGLNGSYKDEHVRNDYLDKCENIFSRGSFNYYITIGSAASAAFLEYTTKSKIVKNHIFLGVTDPVALGLCSTLSPGRNDTDFYNIAGVAYCGNYEDLPNKIHQIFPLKKIRFIYNPKIIEDHQIAKRLQDTFLASKGILDTVQIFRRPLESDFKDTSLVYFSWATFDDAFANQHDLIKKIKYLVSTTYTHAMYGLVPIAVTTDDNLIGQMGAQILYQNLKLGTPLGTIDVSVPPWQSYVNVAVAYGKGLTETQVNLCKIPY